MLKLHILFYRINGPFEQELEGHKKTMWLFSDDADVKRKMSTGLSTHQKRTILLSQG